MIDWVSSFIVRGYSEKLTGIVVQGIFGAKEIIKYFNFIGKGFRCNVVKGCSITTVEPMSEKRQMKIDNLIDRQAKRFFSQLIKKEYPAPSLLMLMLFRMARTTMGIMLDKNFRDFTYYSEKGWFESDYYYPVKLNPMKKMFGKIFDMIGTQMAKNS